MMVHLIDGTYELFRHYYGRRRFEKGKDARGDGGARHFSEHFSGSAHLNLRMHPRRV
jgi:hypothetical protein